MNRYLILALLLALTTPAIAGNDNSNGGCQGNCSGGQPGNASATGGDAYAGAAAGAIAGSVSNSGASIGDIRNTNTAAGGSVLGSGNSNNTNVANGGKGGEGGIGFGGDAKQGQDQLQGQAQSSTNKNVNGQAQSASSDQTQHQSSYSGANQSQDASNKGVSNTTSVSFEDVANAPPVYLGNISATMSCSGGFNAGGSSQDGAGALGFSWVSGDCRSVVAADKFRELGMVDVSCRILKTTKGFKRAVKADPSLASVDCTTKPAPAAVVVPPPQASTYAPRIPRG